MMFNFTRAFSFPGSIKSGIRAKIEKQKLIRRDVLDFAFPIITEQALVVFMGIMNAIMASRIGKEAVSGIGVVDSVNNIFIAFISALAVGSTVVVAYYSGQGNMKGANEAAKQGLFSGLILTIAITVLLSAFRTGIIHVLYGSAEPLVIANALTYFNITIFSYPLIAVTSIACGVLRGAGDARTPMKITILMNFLNILLSYTLIYGVNAELAGIHVYLPGFKVKGAALGISIARLTGAALSVYVLLKGSRIIRLTSLHRLKIDMDLQKSIFRVGIPASVESILFNSGKLITQVFIVSMGTASIAANYVASSVSSFIIVPGNAIGIAATAMVGQSMGKGEKNEAGKLLIYLVKFSMVCFLISCILTFLFAPVISRLYTQVDEVIGIASILLRQNSIFSFLFWSTSFVMPAGLKGAGDTRFTMVVSIVCMWTLRITIGYLLGISLKLGVQGVWMGMHADWIVRSVLFSLRVRSGKWKDCTVITSV